MKRRTEAEIKEDRKRIEKAAESARSMNDIQKSTHLTLSEIQTSLGRNSQLYMQIIKELEENRSRGKGSFKKREFILEIQETEEEFDSEVEENLETEENSETEVEPETKDLVIDASVCGTEGIEERLKLFCDNKGTVVFTSTTIKELDAMQKFRDQDAVVARHILALGAENPKSFRCVLIDETVGIPDDCIIKFCADNKESVSLLTADKVMTLKARMYDVETEYIKKQQDKSVKTETTDSTIDEESKTEDIATFNDAYWEDGKLFLLNFGSLGKIIVVQSNGKEYSDGVRELQIGDDVFIAIKNLNYISFIHFKITSLTKENNCKRICQKRIYDNENVNKINDFSARYKSFINDCRIRFN